MKLSAMDDAVRQALRAGIRLVEDELLPHGEIPNYRCRPNGSWEYCFSPLASAYVHDALSCFDPRSEWFESTVLEQTGARRQGHFSRAVAGIRGRIRRFLAWQQDSHGGWRFFGQGSSLPPDLEATACAATSLLEVGRSRNFAGLSAHGELVDTFLASDGSLDSPGSRGIEEIDSTQHWVANAGAIRYTLLTGGRLGSAGQALERATADSDSRFALYYVAARGWKQVRLPTLRQIAEPVTGAFWRSPPRGPLSTALALSCVK